jgi:hypothetical protein
MRWRLVLVYALVLPSTLPPEAILLLLAPDCSIPGHNGDNGAAAKVGGAITWRSSSLVDPTLFVSAAAVT